MTCCVGRPSNVMKDYNQFGVAVQKYKPQFCGSLWAPTIALKSFDCCDECCSAEEMLSMQVASADGRPNIPRLSVLLTAKDQ